MHQSAASHSFRSSKVIIAGVIEKKGGGGDKHEQRKVQTMSTILKLQFSSLASRPEGKKKNPTRDAAPFHLLLRPVGVCRRQP